MSIQTNSDGLQRILQAVNSLPEGTQLPTLSNPGTASDLASGKQLIGQNGNIITGTHQCQAGVTVKRYPTSGLGTFTTDSSGTATVNCGWQPDVVYIQGNQGGDSSFTVSNSVAIVFAEENRENPLTVMWTDGGLLEEVWEKSSTGFTVYMRALDYSLKEYLVPNKTFSFVAIKYTA